MTYTLIENDEQLANACEHFSQQKVLAIDTEFKRENTYFPIPCLFQIGSVEKTVCIDPFKIENFQPLKDLLSNLSIVKIFHAGRQDLEIFYYSFELLPRPIFDTQIAAAILGHPSQVGYAKLVEEMLGVTLDKSLTRADWEKRPLPKDQLDYAANDVIFLLQVYNKQIEALQHLNRLHWPDADCEAALNESLYKIDTKLAWKKIKSIHHLDDEARLAASLLATWREETAIKKNRPRKFIFDNAVIFELAQKRPHSIQEFENLEKIPAFVKRKYSKKIVDLMNNTSSESSFTPDINNTRLSDEQNGKVKLLQKEMRAIAEKENIEATFICAKKDIEKLVLGERNLALLHGWRKELAGNKILGMLE